MFLSDKITEIVLFDSMETIIKKSKFQYNKIIKFNTIFSMVDLKRVKDKKIVIPKNLIGETESEYDFTEELKALDESVVNKEKIRIWASKASADEYLLVLFICNYLKDKNASILVVFADEYYDDYFASYLHHEQLGSVAGIAHELTKEDVNNYAKEWEKLIKENEEMRIIENAEIKSVPYSYYDEEIKEIVKNSGEVKMGDLVEKLIEKHIGSDMEYTYLIQRLIEKQELVIVKQGERFYSSLIGIK